MNIVYLDGNFLAENEAHIPISDRGLLMGDGVFATIQVKDGSPLFLKRHLIKLDEQAKKLSLFPISIDETTVGTLIEKNRAFDGVWRLKIYYTGGDDIAMRLPKDRKGRVFMILKPYFVPPYGALKVGLFPQTIVALQSGFKSLSHISRYMVMENALVRNFDDCITMGEKGILLETAFGNIFWVKGSSFYTPHPALPLHFGTTISIASEIASEAGFSTHYVKASLSEIPEEASLFRTNTMGGIRPIKFFEGQQFPIDPSLERLFTQEYAKKIEKESKICC